MRPRLPAALTVTFLLLSGASGCRNGCTKSADAQSSQEDLEAAFRSMKAGGAFTRPELLDLDSASTTTWSILTISSATSSAPMSNGSSNCRAYGMFLRGGDDTTPWAAVAVFCDDQGLVRAPSKRAGQTILTWPVTATTASKLQLDLHFVDALEPGRQLLWISEKSWGDGALCAMEYGYVRADNTLKNVLQVVGADPAAYFDYNAGDEFNAKQAAAVTKSYEAAFFGDTFPKRFRASHLSRGEPLEAVYELTDGAYRWLPPLELRDHFR